VSIVVSDTSPLRALNHLGALVLLERLYGSVIVPPAVASEFASPRGPAAAVIVGNIPFVSVQAPTSVVRVQQFLDPGEAEAIALAIEIKAEALLIDEARGRAMAASAGLSFVGVLGILQRSKREGLIPEIRSRLDRLRSEIQFFTPINSTNKP
jgi:predicted nucleic acid-binding protein